MNMCLYFKCFLLACAILVSASSHAQTHDQNMEGTALLEKLKEYMRDNDPRAYEVMQELIGYASIDVVQFFLENITWKHTLSTDVDVSYDISNNETIFDPVLKSPAMISIVPIVEALFKMNNVPLNLCVNALLEYQDGTMEAQMVAHVARKFHGIKFLREIERLAEASPDSERLQIMKERIANNKPIASIEPYGKQSIKTDLIPFDNQSDFDDEFNFLDESIDRKKRSNVEQKEQVAITTHIPLVTPEDPPPPIINSAKQIALWVCVGVALVLCLYAALFILWKKP